MTTRKKNRATKKKIGGTHPSGQGKKPPPPPPPPNAISYAVGRAQKRVDAERIRNGTHHKRYPHYLNLNLNDKPHREMDEESQHLYMNMSESGYSPNKNSKQSNLDKLIEFSGVSREDSINYLTSLNEENNERVLAFFTDKDKNNKSLKNLLEKRTISNELMYEALMKE
jgi:hypothetical protein